MRKTVELKSLVGLSQEVQTVNYNSRIKTSYIMSKIPLENTKNQVQIKNFIKK